MGGLLCGVLIGVLIAVLLLIVVILSGYVFNIKIFLLFPYACIFFGVFGFVFPRRFIRVVDFSLRF